MIIRRTNVDETLAPFMFKADTYCDENGNHPTRDFISAEDVISGKWKINASIDPEISERIIGQAHMFKFNKEPILVIQ